MGAAPIITIVFALLLFWGILYLIAYVVLRLIFRFYFSEYEMDSKSMKAISFKTAGAFLVTSILSFFVARWLFIRSGMEKKAALKISALWIILMALVVAVLIYSDAVHGLMTRLARLVSAPF